MDLREIRYFARVARAGSFSRAAGELRIAQPALSRKVRRLEDELGVALLVRHGRGVRLTNAGAVFLENAESIGRLVQQASEQVKAGGTALVGHVALAVPPAAGLMLVPPVIERFKREWPLVSLHIREGISSLLQEWLLDRRIDVAVLHNPPVLPAFDIIPVLRERLMVIGPPRRGSRRGHAPPRQGLRIRDLVDLPLIVPSLPHSNRRVLEQAAVQHGVQLRVAYEVDSVVLTKRLVQQGLGYGILTYSAVQHEVARGELSADPIVRPPLVSTLAVATLNTVAPSRFVRALIADIQEVLRALATGGEWSDARAVGRR